VPEPTIDWEAIERSPDLRELVDSRKRFVQKVGGVALAIALFYVISSGVFPGLHGTQVIGKISLGFLGGIGLIVMAWVVTFLYMRRSDAVWGPLERRIAEDAHGGRGAER
jgi:uncharacterized membrane protein (DUF485 family)